MPELTKVFTIQVTPERFLEACSDNELKELDLLLASERYQRRIREPQKKEIGFKPDFKVCLPPTDEER
jgi:hypothetical protein